MTVLMLGTLVPSKTKQYCFKYGQRTSAADSVQRYMIHGLEAIEQIEEVDVIGAVRLKSWPKSKIISLKNSEEKLNKGKNIGVGYFNLPIFGFKARENGIIRESKKWAISHKNDTNVTVLIYSMHSPFMKATMEIKRIIPTAKIVLTVADLPLFMDMRGSIRKFLKQIDWKRITKLMRCVDKYLLYTKYMAEYLKLNDNQWMVFEGLIDERKIVCEKQNKSKERYALYAGNLDPRYGIDLLIKAFSKLPKQEKLVIYGAGYDKERIENLVRPLENVEYKGQITPDEVFEKMKEASILINPRPASLGLAKYSCPSKTFEYLASGTPLIMTRLPGLPDEYLEYVNLFSGETAEDYANDIHGLFQKSDEELCQMGLNGAKFLKEYKSDEVVMKKVIKWINGD